MKHDQEAQVVKKSAAIPSTNHSAAPLLALVIPCYNEEAMLHITLPELWKKLDELIKAKLISDKSFALYVNDGSTDHTWEILSQAAEEDPQRVGAISLSHNRGHQSALLAGLLHAKDYADITISIDADLQDDLQVIEKMIEAYHKGYDVVCGVRDDRASDTGFKRGSAQGYYRVMKMLGVELVYNHADYRMLSRPVLEALSGYEEVNLFLRGIIPQIGFKSTVVPYRRTERVAGESKYPLRKMLKLAWDGITSFSVAPLRAVTLVGSLVFLASILMAIYIVVRFATGQTVTGWASLTLSLWALGGLILLAIGIAGEYIGKIYLETKARPRFHIIAEAGQANRENQKRDESIDSTPNDVSSGDSI